MHLPHLPWPTPRVLAGGKLRDVPPFEHSRQLAADAAALPLPPSLQAAVQAALPLNQQQALADVPTCMSRAGGGRGTASSSLHSLDPWLVLEGGVEGGSGGEGVAAPGGAGAAAAQAAGKAVPPWVGGAVKRRRRDLRYWPTPSAVDAPLLTIAEQLQRRGGEERQAGSATQ